MYFLWERDKAGHIVSVNGVDQDISDQEVILTSPMEIAIRNKVLDVQAEHDRFMFDEAMFGRNPYGITSNHETWVDESPEAYKCYHRSGNNATTSFAHKTIVAAKHQDSIDRHKMCLVKASGIGKDGTSTPFTIGPNEMYPKHTS